MYLLRGEVNSKIDSPCDVSIFFFFFFLRLKGKLFLVDYRLAGWFRVGKERRILKNDGIKGMTSFRGVLSFFFREIRGIGRFDKGLGKDYVP